MRFLPTKIHGVLDYLVGILLMSMPWILDFAEGGAEVWVPVFLGVAAIVYSLCTHYEWGAVSWLSMKAHLTLDLLSGVLLATSPWLFGFANYVYVPHLVAGLFEIVASLVTRQVPGSRSETTSTYVR